MYQSSEIPKEIQTFTDPDFFYYCNTNFNNKHSFYRFFSDIFTGSTIQFLTGHDLRISVFLKD